MSIQLPAQGFQTKIVSGYLELTTEQLKIFVKDIIQTAGRRGVRIAVDRYNTHVAFRTGALTRKLENMINSQIIFPEGVNKITVNFDHQVMAEIKSKKGFAYAAEHIDGKPHHPGDVSPYTKPTKKGTRPIQSDEVMREVKKEAMAQVIQDLKASGLEVRAYGKGTGRI